MTNIEKLLQCRGFEWDQGNIEKNWAKHNVSPVECEQIFFNQPLIIIDDPKHSTHEERYAAFGRTDAGRLLAVIFIRRGELLRVISARDMNRKERNFYEENQ
jgi:uncharacterized DUF497 family protein